MTGRGPVAADHRVQRIVLSTQAGRCIGCGLATESGTAVALVLPLASSGPLRLLICRVCLGFGASLLGGPR